jgi:hypothetical protein
MAIKITYLDAVDGREVVDVSDGDGVAALKRDKAHFTSKCDKK